MAEPCHFFDKLPAEMRNKIYELVFTSNSAKEPIDLATADPPRKAVIMTCCQVYNEAGLLYKDALRDYWCKTEFYVDRRSTVCAANISTFETLSTINLIDVNHSRNLTVRILTPSLREKWRLVDPRGYWDVTRLKPKAGEPKFHVSVRRRGPTKRFVTYVWFTQDGEEYVFKPEAPYPTIMEQLKAFLVPRMD